jgi:hypothetical protein
MVSSRHAWLGLLLCAILGGVHAESCTKGSELEPALCRLRLPKIVKVVILENAAGTPRDGDGMDSCREFVMTEKQVRRYFSKAMTTSANEAHAKLDWSPCHASGSLVFSDGRTATWDINLSRAGSLSIAGADNLLLYCPSCNFKPFGS